VAKIVFKAGIDMSELDLSDFTGGSVGNLSRSSVTLTAGEFSATITGESFGYDFWDDQITGTAHTFTASHNGEELLVATKLDLDLGVLYSHRDDAGALIDDIFGGRDTILGSAETDVIYGFGGGDRIDGNRGADLLAGGGGADVFVFDRRADSTKSAPDTILDLERKDFLDLSALGVGLEDVKIRYQETLGVTMFSIDLDGDGRSDMGFLAVGDHSGFDTSHILV
jgi:Ca2+-binding RTX toxin-like protein